MMEMTISNVITIAVYLITFGTVWGRISVQLSNLEKKVEKHNRVIDRTYTLEKETGVMKEQIVVANHRIKDLEAKK